VAGGVQHRHPAVGVATIHQMVTAWPGSSPVVDSEKEMLLSSG